MTDGVEDSWQHYLFCGDLLNGNRSHGGFGAFDLDGLLVLVTLKVLPQQLQFFVVLLATPLTGRTGAPVKDFLRLRLLILNNRDSIAIGLQTTSDSLTH